MPTQTIHQDQPILTHGTPLEEANAAVILLHGRGATAESMLPLAAALPNEGVAYLLPQAAGQTWYPYSGFGPLAANEPYLSSALELVGAVLQEVEAAGIAPEKTVIGGFSQGGVLACEFVTRHLQRYGGVLLFSGALMGPPDREPAYEGALDGTPVFIGGAQRDAWVTAPQLEQTAAVLEALGGQVTLEIAPGSQHTIRPAEVEQAISIIQQVA